MPLRRDGTARTDSRRIKARRCLYHARKYITERFQWEGRGLSPEARHTEAILALAAKQLEGTDSFPRRFYVYHKTICDRCPQLMAFARGRIGNA